MKGGPPILYVFAWAQSKGVPTDGWIETIRPERLDSYVLDVLKKNRKHRRMFVWDWQSDGVRMRSTWRSNRGVEWSAPEAYWLRKN